MNKPRLRSTFQKLALAFLALGVMPMILVCLVFLRQFDRFATQSIENTMEEANYYAQSKVNGLFTAIDQSMDYLYDYSAGEYAALYSLLESPSAGRNDRRLYMGLMLDRFIQADPSVSAAWFVSARGEVFCRFYGQQKSQRAGADARHVLRTGEGDRTRSLSILPAAGEEAWCNDSTDTVLSLSRNYMDTRSLQTITNTALGTLYVDVDTSALDELLGTLRLGEGGNAFIIDRRTGEVLYRLRQEAQTPLPQELAPNGGDFSDERYTVFHQPIGRSDYHLVMSFDRLELYKSFRSGQILLIVMLCVAAGLVIALSLGVSGRISKPARELKRAMGEVQKGKLNTRVDIRSGDELEYLGDGFNQMVERLDGMIQEVYVAEICQRDAELNALKMQIQPHYLYNTLDVIRMSALDGGDVRTARLIESLSHQLRYVIGDHRDRVRLRQELDNVQEYGVLIAARYEGRIGINIEAADSDLDLLVPKLLLQPFVENAVKHGLRDQSEGGTVLIEAARLDNALQILVFNDGAPIEPARLEHIRSFLDRASIGEQDSEGIVSVGMKNTYDRIKLNCGREYGFTMDSGGSMGTVVTIRLPIWEDEKHAVEGTAG